MPSQGAGGAVMSAPGSVTRTSARYAVRTPSKASSASASVSPSPSTKLLIEQREPRCVGRRPGAGLPPLAALHDVRGVLDQPADGQRAAARRRARLLLGEPVGRGPEGGELLLEVADEHLALGVDSSDARKPQRPHPQYREDGLRGEHETHGPCGCCRSCSRSATGRALSWRTAWRSRRGPCVATSTGSANSATRCGPREAWTAATSSQQGPRCHRWPWTTRRP